MQLPIEFTWPQGEMFQMMDQRVTFPLFVGGYGCGKSEILVANAIRDIMEFQGCKIGIYAPTLDLLSLNLIPRLEERLTELGIVHHLQKQKNILSVQGNRKFYFRSMDNPSRIVAYEVYRSHVDEADLMVTAIKGEEAWNRIIARNRQKRLKKFKKLKTHREHFNMVSAYTTPESFKFTYKRWKKQPGEGYRYVRAPTRSNWTLDETFVQNLQDTYTPEQCKAYLEGIWTNIFTGTVYSYFDRDKHHTDKVITKDHKTLHISCDFNYGGSCGAVYEKTPNGLYMLSEFVTHDTEQMVQEIEDKYQIRIKATKLEHKDLLRVIEMFPDATGAKGSTNASVSDIAMLRDAGFHINAKGTNPRITDRINAVQKLLYNGEFKINTNECPRITEAMEEHAFSQITGLPEKVAGPATIDDWNDAMGYCPAFLYPIKKIHTITGEMPI